MKQLIFLFTACLPVFSFAQYTYEHLNVNWLNQSATAAQYTYQNLRLYPILAKNTFQKNFSSVGKYKTLQEAIKDKKILITEKGSGGTVNTLQVQNTSNDTIIILSGEIVKGGQQDRIISEDILLVPKSKKTDVPVFCVEAGRWSYNTRGDQKNFSGYYKVGSMSLRKVVDKKAKQNEVWSKVEELNSANKTTSQTKTYTALTNSPDFNDKLTAYTNFFKKAFTDNSNANVIGVIVVTDNKVLGCDMFATHELFSKNFENLLSSYATEAILYGKAITIQPAAVKTYMDKLLSGEKEQAATVKEKGKEFISNGKKLKVSSYE